MRQSVLLTSKEGAAVLKIKRRILLVHKTESIVSKTGQTLKRGSATTQAKFSSVPYIHLWFLNKSLPHHQRTSKCMLKKSQKWLLHWKEPLMPVPDPVYRLVDSISQAPVVMSVFPGYKRMHGKNQHQHCLWHSDWRTCIEYNLKTLGRSYIKTRL